MIHELDESLETLIKREALDGSGVEVVFDAPTKDWASRRNTPTVDIYLYDIREDTRRRQVGEIQERNEAGVLVSRGKPARFFRLSYLLTAWTQRPEDEHRLLSAMLSCLLRNQVFPFEDLVGSLAANGLPVLIEVAKPLPESRQISEVWTALGGELKAGLDVIVTAAMTSEPVPVTAPPPSEGPVIQTFGEPGQESQMGARPKPPSPEDAATANGQRNGSK